MKILPFLFLPVFLLAHNYSDLLNMLEKNQSYQSAKELERASMMLYEASRGKNLPTLDATMSAVYLNDTPTMHMHLPSQQPLSAQVGKKEQYSGSLVLTYPLFTGFAISSSIDKAKFEQEKASLSLINLKRNLALQMTELYSAVLTEQQSLKAYESSHIAISDAYNKANGFYKNGLLAQSELFAIEAKKYEMQAQIADSKNKIMQLLNQISRIVQTKIDNITPIANQLKEPDIKSAKDVALEHREDLLSVGKTLDIAQSNIELAKSKYYPTISLVGAIKREGDSLELNGDGYSNPDKSYAGVAVSYNLFNGLSDAKNLEAARASKMSAFHDFEEYKSQINTELDNGFLELYTIDSKLQSALEEEKASEAYAKLAEGRFNNQLISADELSRSIASLAGVKAKVASLRSQKFNQTSRLWLMCGYASFEKNVMKQNH